MTHAVLTSPDDHLLADLVEELSQKLAEGNSADVEAFLGDHGDHAAKLRSLIPTLQMLVEIGSSPVANGRSRSVRVEDDEHPTGGHPVLGDFRILREVGRGGMGVVYEAEQLSLRRRVALKVLPTAAMLDPRALQRFRNEAQAAAALHHSQIVPIYGVGCERGVHYYAMQFIDGLTLAEVITSLRQSAGLPPLYQPEPPHQPDAQARDSSAKAEIGKRKAEARHQPEAQAKETVDQPRISSSPAPAPQPPLPAPSATETDVLAALSTDKSRTSPAWFRRIAEQFAQVADALHHAHELGVTHRDIKPANLMLDRLGHIWITDFGLARIEGEGNLTMTGDLIGTLRYMSPEQSLAKRIGIDHRTDIYSLGITLYELLTLHPALPGHGRQELLRQIAFEEPKLPRKHNPSIPKDLETIVLKMIEKNPAERYQTAADLAADLERFLDDRHITARRPGPVQRLYKIGQRHRGIVLVTIVFLLLTTIGLGAATWRMAVLKNEAVEMARREQKERIRASKNLERALTAVWEILWAATPDDGGRLSSDLSNAKKSMYAGAVQLFESYLTDDELDEQAQQERGWVYLSLNNVYIQEANKDKKKETAFKALALFEELHQRHPDDPDITRDLGRCHLSLLKHYAFEKLWQEAEASCGKAVAVFTQLHEQDPNRKDVAFYLAQAHLQVNILPWSVVETSRGTITYQGPGRSDDRQIENSKFRRMLQPDNHLAFRLLSDLTKDAPANRDYQMWFRTAVSKCLLESGVHGGDDSLSVSLALRDRLETLAMEQPKLADFYKELLISISDRIIGYFSRKGDTSRVRAEQERQIAVQEDRIKGLTTADSPAKLIQIRSDLAIRYESMGLSDKAATELNKAIENRRESSAELSKQTKLLEYLGRIEEGRGNLDEARNAYEENVAQYIVIPKDLKGRIRAQLLLGDFYLRQRRLLSPTHVDSVVKWYAQAFVDEPSLAEDVRTGHRYNAACAALLTPPMNEQFAKELEDAERVRLTHQALVWLKDDLAGWKKIAESVQPERLSQVVQNLVHWQEDPDLATLRDDKQVQQLPAEDQELCRKLWADHAELVKSLQARLPAEKK